MSCDVRKTIVMCEMLHHLQQTGWCDWTRGNCLSIGKIGDAVKGSDNLAVMESMKMENNILSEKNGVIKRINVEAGQAVRQDDILMELE